MCINQDLVAFRPTTDALISKFLFYVLKTRASSIIENGIKPGVTVQSLQRILSRLPDPPSTTRHAGKPSSPRSKPSRLWSPPTAHCRRFEKKIQASLAASG